MIFLSLIDSIPELLYKHNCVIIPGFGGFITNYKHAGFEESRNLISPSCKKVAFNQSLIENDGLLVNSWAQKKGISYQEALVEVESFKNFLNERILTNKSYDFKNIGTFYLNSENKIIFIPYQGLNFLESSYGLYPVKIKSLQAYPGVSIETNTSPVSSTQSGLADREEAIEPGNNRRGVLQYRIPHFLKAASIITILAVSAIAIYYLAQHRKGTLQVKNKANEQQASIITLDTNTEIPLELNKKETLVFDYRNERQKMLEIKKKLELFAEKNSLKNESYNVILGYYPSAPAAQKILNTLKNEYPGAVISEKTEAGYCIIVESFYKHTTARAFSVIIKQNGYKNVKIEKQVVFEN